MIGIVCSEGMAGVWVEEDNNESYGERDIKKERVAFAGRRFVVKGGSAEREEHREVSEMLEKKVNSKESTLTLTSRASFYGWRRD